MALIETYARLCGTGQTVTTAAFSTNAFDLGAGRTGKALAGGRLVVARFGVTTAAASATAGTAIDLVIYNTNGSTGAISPTVTAPGGINTTTNVLTATAHGLANSTAVVMSTAGTLPTFSPAYTAGQFLYVRNATDDTFQLSYTPGGDIIDITAAGSGSILFTEALTTVAAAIAVPLQRLGAGCIYELAISPPGVAKESFAARYIIARFNPTAALSAGTFICDLVSGFGQDGQPKNKLGYVTA